MAAVEVSILESVLAPREVTEIVDLWHRFPSYMPSNYRAPRQPLQASVTGRTSLAPELGWRHDVSSNFVRTGGRLGRRDEPRALLSARTNYFRGTYANRRTVSASGIEGFFRHPQLMEAARVLFGGRVSIPAVVYANVLLPGQELGIHTDVPEFLGASRAGLPGWFLVVMRHSKLFEDRRVPIATVIAYFGEPKGGDFVYYPDGPLGAPVTFTPHNNTAVVIDGDSVFHGVDRVEGDDSALMSLRSDARLGHAGGRHWVLRSGERRLSSYASDDLRFSVSWKAYCFADSADRSAFAAGQARLPIDAILRRLVEELCARGRLADPDHHLSDAELAELLIDEFVPFPPANPGSPVRTNEHSGESKRALRS
jgi:hypothetical protein